MTLTTDSTSSIDPPTALPGNSPDSGSSASDNDDAYNTADARIYFGPLRSPERRYVPIIASRDTLYPEVSNSPLRRSPRFSTPQPRSPSPEIRMERNIDSRIDVEEEYVVQEDEEAVDALLSRPGTPDMDQVLQDEPPSTLAIKISRAHDNPSPPPSPPADMGLIDFASASPGLPLPSLNASLLVSYNASDGEGLTPPTSNSVTPGLSRNISPVPPKTPGHNPPPGQPDLISFEAFSTPAAVFRAIPPAVTETRQLPLNEKPSVDDLFAQSPSLPLPLQNAQTCIPSIAIDNPSGCEENKREAQVDTVKESNEEESVLKALLLPDAEEESYNTFTSQSPSPNIDDNGDEAVWTPTRRSTRKHSVTREQTSVVTSHLTPPSQLEHKSADGSHRQHDPGDSADVQELVVEPLTGRSVWRQEMSSPPKPVFLRELGSLSPTSNDLLSSLVAPPPNQAITFSLTIPTNADNSTRRPFPPSSSKPVLPQTPRRSASPVRFASPSRSAVRLPNNTRLQPMSLDDPTCTPARRIPIEQAVAQGQMSPLKGSQLLASSRIGLDVAHKSILTIPPTDSPARRVLTVPEIVTSGAQKKWQGIRFGSPTRATSKERFSSVEPPEPGSSKGKYRERDGSAPPSSSSSFLRPPVTGSSVVRGTPKPAKLPFPLVPATKDGPTTIAEEHDSSMASPTKPGGTVFASPNKSSLKQTTSRIPRTVKPYAKPVVKASVDKGKSVMRSALTSEPSKIIPTSTETLPGGKAGPASSGDSKAKISTSSIRKVDIPSATLKRKRVVLEKPSPVKPRPVVVLRQVPRVVVPSAPSTSKATVRPSITIQKNTLQKIRRVIDKPPDVEAQPVLLPPSPQQSKSLVSEIDIADDDVTPSNVRINEVPDDKTLPSSPDPIVDATAPPGLVIPDSVRRTTRARKVLNPSLNSDVFGTSDTKTRRKPSTQSSMRGDTAYYGMSATALRALTTSNTTRNQRYVAAKLETEIIRREGDRPESPAVKIKTISQREQDEKAKQRKERAARRSRLSVEVNGNSDEEGGRSDGDFESESESDWDDDQSGSPAPKRHKRGPGDEEDYRTPVRKLKRLKLGDDDDNDSEVSTENERRVKWDRGLFTTIYLDQVKLGTRQPPKEITATKGCLAPKAKTLPLDNLGNLPYADSPLTGLVEENVVVKKFVYDNDAEAVEEVIVVKNTRARSKKAKS